MGNFFGNLLNTFESKKNKLFPLKKPVLQTITQR